MACGNGNISRDYLSSAPVTASSSANAMFSSPSLAAPPAIHIPAKRRAPQKGDVVDDKWNVIGTVTKSGANVDAQGNPVDGKVVPRNMSYSKSGRGTVEYFIGPDGTPTFDPERHVHVIHDGTAGPGTVELIITDRTQAGDPHVDHMVLVNEPSGNRVNAAIAEMVKEMNSIPHGPNEPTWP